MILKRTISLLLACCLIIGAVPLVSFAADPAQVVNCKVPEGYHLLQTLPTPENPEITGSLYLGGAFEKDEPTVLYGMNSTFSSNAATTSTDAAAQCTVTIHYGGTDDTYGDYYYVVFRLPSNGNSYAFAYAGGYFTQNMIQDTGTPSGGWAYKHRLYFDGEGQFFYHRVETSLSTTKGLKISSASYKIFTETVENLKKNSDAYCPVRVYALCASDNAAGYDETSHWNGTCSCGRKFDETAHTFGPWTEVKKPVTLADKGSEKRTCESCPYSETRETTLSAEDFKVLTTAPKADVPFYLGATQLQVENTPTYFFKGAWAPSKYQTMDVTTNMASATPMYAEAADGGYKLYFADNGVKTYLILANMTVSEQLGVFVQPAASEEEASVFVWNDEYDTFQTTVEGKGDYYIGNYTSGSTNYTKLSALQASGLGRVDRHPARLYCAAGGEDSHRVCIDAEGNAYDTLQEAVDAVAEGGIVTLNAHLTENITVSKSVVLNLNQKTLTGDITLTNGARLSGMDSATDRYGKSECGKICGRITDGGVEKTYRNEASKKRYVAVHDEASGTWTFNRFYIGMQSITADVTSGNVGYKAAVGGNENVKNALTDDAFGFKVWVEGWENFAKNPTLTRNDFVTDETGTTMGLRIANQLACINEKFVGGELDAAADLQNRNVNAQVTICFADSEPVTSAVYAFSIVQMYQALDADFASFTAEQQDSLVELTRKFPVMKTWKLTNIIGGSDKPGVTVPDGYHLFTALPTADAPVTTANLYLGGAFEEDEPMVLYGMNSTMSAATTSTDAAAQCTVTIHYGGTDDTYGDYYYVVFRVPSNGNSYAITYGSGNFTQNLIQSTGMPSGGWAAKHRLYFDREGQFFYCNDKTVMRGLGLSSENYKFFTETVENLKKDEYCPARVYALCTSDNVAGQDEMHHWSGTCRICGNKLDYRNVVTSDAKLKDLVIVANDQNRSSALALAQQIKTAYGVSLPVRNAAGFQEDGAIYVGTQDYNSYSGLRYSVTTDLKSVSIYLSGSGESLTAAMEYLASKVNGEDGYPYGLTAEYNGFCYDEAAGDNRYEGLDMTLTSNTQKTLGSGVSLHTMKYNVDGKSLRAYAVVVSADSSAKLKVVAAPWDETNSVENPVSLSTVRTYRQQLKNQGDNVLAICNGGFFKKSEGSNLPWGAQIINGDVWQAPSTANYHYSDNWFGVTADGRYVISNTEGYNSTYAGHIQYAVGGGQMLMQNGAAHFTPASASYRTCVGITQNGDLILLCMEETPSYAMAIRAFMDLEMDVADILNLDGGGSTTLYTTSSSYDICGDGWFPREVADAIAIVAG